MPASVVGGLGEDDDHVSTKLLGGRSTPSVWRVYPQRWYVLAVFSLMSMNQCLVWFTYSSNPSATMAYYHVSNAVVDFILNLGPIVYIPVVCWLTWRLTRRNGLHLCITLAACLTLSGTAIRLLPTLSATLRRQYHDVSVACVYVGQTLNAATGPLVIATPSLLSVTWFPEHERVLATAIAVVSNGVGAAVGFPLGSGWCSLPTLLWIEFGMALVPFVAVAAYMPRRPPSPPNATALQHFAHEGAQALGGATAQLEPLAASYGAAGGGGVVDTALPAGATAQLEPLAASYGAAGGGGVVDTALPAAAPPVSFPAFLRSLRAAVQVPALWLLVLAGGIQSGVNSAWGGLLPEILKPQHYDSAAGWMGFASTIAATVSSLVISHVADRCVRRRLKGLILLVLAAAVLCFTWLTLMLPNPGGAAVLSSSKSLVFVAITAGGLFQGAADPLLYELLAEVTFPLSEGASGAILTLVYNIASLVVLAAAPAMSTSTMNTVMTAGLAVGFTLVAVAQDRYHRAEAEARQSGVHAKAGAPP